MAQQNGAAPLKVIAGPDRVVMPEAKTFLNGYAGYDAPRDGRRETKRGATPGAESAAGPAVTVTWSKAAGPGTVAFEDAKAVTTTATFSTLGDYVLELTANNGQTNVSSTVNVTVEAPPPADHLTSVDTKSYKINNPLWNSRAKALILNWIPHCYVELSKPDLAEGGIANFIEAGKKLAGQPARRHVGPPWANAYVHNTIESMAYALMVDAQGDLEIVAAQQGMRAKLDEWIPIVLAAQEPDGYLQTRFTLATNDASHWSARTRGEHEGYVGGYFIEAALAHYQMTEMKDARLYNAARKLADCWYNNLGPAPKREWYDGHEEIEQALVRLGRFVDDTEGTGQGRKYIELAKFLLDCRKNGGDYDQSRLPVVQQYEAVGHAVRAAYAYSAMTDIAMETGDRDYQGAVKSLWNNVVNRKYYVTGGLGSGETSEGFGPNYSLRNNAYSESCANCGELFFQHKMNLLYRDARYADLCEDTLYNAILGDIDLDGKNFYYDNPLDSSVPRYSWHNCPCCVGNIPRTLLQLPTWMYAKDKDGLYVNLFIGSTVDVGEVAGTPVRVAQTTDYPWSGKVVITVNPAARKSFSVLVRVPNRNVSTLYTNTPGDGISTFKVNGSDVSPKIVNGYAVINRLWQAGDKIDLNLPMQVQRIKADDKIAADAGKVALRYGPLIYNIESVDQDITQVLGLDMPLTPEWRGDLLGGVMVIKGKFANGSELTAIPNYARNNRMPVQNGAAGRNRAERIPASIVWVREK
jgi:hypothetical protein